MEFGRITSISRRAARSGAAGAVALSLAVAALAVQAPAVALAAGRGCVIPGNDGPSAALTGVVNSYYPATASAAAGATSISVGARLAGAAPPIAAGDLLLVIQMQDADINGVNSIAYGDGATGRGSTALRSTGLYEYVAATSAVVGGAVTIAGTGAGGGLVNAYDFSAAVTATHGFRTFQVIRVPQYSSATVVAGLTAAAWDGTAHAGGVLAVDVAGALNLNTQTISVDQLGFKGGLGVAQAGGADANTDYAVASGRGDHGYKAEGIAGTPKFLYDAIAGAAVNGTADGYPLGDAARGAPGNAGGGGTDFDPVINDQNSGGGGGANGGQGGMGGNSWNTNQPVGGLGGAAGAPPHDRRGARRRHQPVGQGPLIGHCRRETDDAAPWRQPAQPGEAKAQQIAALVAGQRMKLIDDDSAQAGEDLVGIGIGDQQSEGFRRGQHHLRWGLALALPLGCGRVARAGLHRDGQPHLGQGLGQVAVDVDGKRLQR